MKSKRLKVLLGCYACDPNFGSEPGVGWQFAKLIASHHDVHALVEKDEFENNLRAYTERHPEEVRNITFHFIRRNHHNLLRKIWPPSYYWFYRKWQKEAYLYALELDKKENFDVVHQITLAGYREPGYLWKLNKKFIWGPIGGLNQTAWSILPCMGLYGIIFYAFRNIMNAFQKRFSYAARVVSKKAHAILTSDNFSQRDILHLWHRNALVMKEVGTTETFHHHKCTIRQEGEELIICWAGVHEPRKGLGLLIDALAQCKASFQLHVLGHGPCTTKWQKLAQKHNLTERIHFHGKILHQDVFRYMAESHVFCLTSLSEGGTTTVAMEALQHGLPIIALNHCPFASAINEQCGIHITVTTPRQIIKDIAKAIDFLYENETIRQSMARASIARSRDFSWDSKLAILDKLYHNSTPV